MTSSKLNKSLLAAALTAVLTPASFAAANADDGMTSIKGETVVVTAARTSQDLLDTNSSVAVVSGKELKNLTTDSVPEMLRSATGVRLTSDGTPGTKRITIRGENALRTLLMVDGQRIDEQKSKSGAPMLINPYFIDRIEVVKGPASVLYGSDAIGGIVNVITKEASEKPLSFDGGASFIGANNSYTEYANLSGTLDRFQYAFGAFNTNAGDLYLKDHKPLENTAYDAHGFNGDFSYEIMDKVRLGYAGEYYDSSSETSTTVKGSYSAFRGEIPKWDRQKHQVYLKAHDINDYIAAFETSVYYQEMSKDFYSTPTRGINVGVFNEQKSLGGNMQLELSLSDMFYLVTGYDGRIEKMSSFSDVDVNMGSAYKGKYVMDDNDYKQTSHALYAMLSTYLTDELTLNTGLRYNYIDNTAGNSMFTMQHTTNGASSPVINRPITNNDESFSKLVGSAGLVYRPFDNAAFRLNWSQGFRAPTVQELFLTTATGEMQYGNPQLEPEKSNNFELGFRWDDGALMADVALFYTVSDNYIETRRLPAGLPGSTGVSYTYQNIAKATTWGSEVGLSYLINNTWEPYANMTYMVREYEIGSQSTKDTGTPNFFGNAGLRYHGEMFQIDGYANFATTTDDEDLGGTSYFSSMTYDGYVTANLTVSTRVGPEDQFTLYGSVENIFDKEYQTNQLIHEPGRFVSVGVRAQF
ncbi:MULTISPECIES: TonB-dependent receptor [unclassified Anaerobiospirillum]|uniref:TonB-dependent receptor plug domain-containing protein n=1 Tax=unclassified Anaerobiospirillum TaxID=2647410 RepID=UPI001FF60F43|nr:MULTISPECIES: TonB-dependent receptor [unclassified Anaerobiospirillum]MCK0534105.1 TonB-dependent receptor [Anaerobiospirillum sp. NML120511]MCK0539349.1 TonB-dependent receptor [Anaerobiospirillum sp. NML02-A-032]